MLTRAPASPAQGLPPWTSVFQFSLFLYNMCGLEKLGLVDQNWLERNFSVFLLRTLVTLTDPLRIQPWSQDRRNQTKSNRESEMSMESRQKRTDKKKPAKDIVAIK